jgi:hypothetical protein
MDGGRVKAIGTLQEALQHVSFDEIEAQPPE